MNVVFLKWISCCSTLCRPSVTIKVSGNFPASPGTRIASLSAG
jgi:hypothetical protein